MVAAWIPFAAAAGLQALSPATDTLWKAPFARFYASLPTLDTKTPAHLASAASWASDIAQALPSAALTGIGVVSLFEKSRGPILAIVAILGLLLIFVAIIYVANNTAHLHDYDEKRWLLWSPLQWLQFTLNIAGVTVAVVLGSTQ